MSEKKVTVVVPVFNVERYLRECLDSILSQSLEDIEVICGDGGSTDGSLSIIEEYMARDSRVRCISKEGSGYGQSLNDCIRAASGEYIGIVESDDIVKPGMFERLYSLAKGNDLDWIRSDIFFFYSERPIERRLVRESIVYGAPIYGKVLNPQEDYGPYKSGMRTWSGIYRRSFLIYNDIWHNETPGGSYQDVGFYLKTLYYATRVYFLDEAFYMWRQDNPGSSIHYDEAKLVAKSFREWELNREYLEEKGLGPRAYASYNYRKFYSYKWTVEMTSGELRESTAARARSELQAALDNGEIDRGFFTDSEWDLFVLFLRTGKTSSFGSRWRDFSRNNPGIRKKVSRVYGRIVRHE